MTMYKQALPDKSRAFKDARRFGLPMLFYILDNPWCREEKVLRLFNGEKKQARTALTYLHLSGMLDKQEVPRPAGDRPAGSLDPIVLYAVSPTMLHRLESYFSRKVPQ